MDLKIWKHAVEAYKKVTTLPLSNQGKNNPTKTPKKQNKELRQFYDKCYFQIF